MINDILGGVLLRTKFKFNEMEVGIDMKKIMGMLVLFIAFSLVMCGCGKSAETQSHYSYAIYSGRKNYS